MNEYPRLVDLSNEQTIPITSEKFLVGRSLKCNFVLDSVFVSRIHFILEKSNGMWNIRDKSSNGTFCNDLLIGFDNSSPLKNGDIIKLYNANTEFRFELYPRDPGITDELLCQALDSVVTVKSQEDEQNIFGDHCYEVDQNSDHPVVNEVIISEHGDEASDIIIPCPLPESSSETDRIKNKRCSSSRESPSANDDQSPFKKNKSGIGEEIIKLDEEDQEPPDKKKEKENSKKEKQINFDLIEEEMQCSICSEMFIKAVTLNCCHTFCKYCIDQWKKQQCFCPICRQKITSMAPTLVLDNYIEKIVCQMDDETKERRKRINVDRLTIEDAPSTSKKNLPHTSSSTSSTSDSSRTMVTVTISSDEEFDSEENDDYDDSYTGVPGGYYGGYGRCFNCNRKGHWAPGCPYR
ncbi:hypothetical protein HHI36_022034 [Cryptolaemus montrouzieri]|uniref:E3 ubiquitin-protein ligase CHFR n=1 Tax=Cryptolaemus montrouzieri TaxID=559131 RepID=A0ABD2MYS9_9CUCU